MGDLLNRAREFESRWIQDPPMELRPLFHFTPPVGWLNDPNGFSWYDGQYHLFYQYYPYNTHWGAIHWGHAVSHDLLQWTYRPAALAPENDYDKDGCFSGSGITMDDGRHLLMYTGYVYDEEDPEHRGIQTQNIAIGDGTDYEKYVNNPVIRTQDIPDTSDPYDFRDPKIWKTEDGSYQAVIASGDLKLGAKVLVFHSPDGLQWKYSHCMTVNDNRFGKMWECPDYFLLDSQEVLLVNAMDMAEEGSEFHKGNNGLFILGHSDSDQGIFCEHSVFTLDHGMDFYAGQTMETTDGRRILIGWMQNPGTTLKRTVERSYYGQMSIPRELKIRNGRLVQSPVRELERYRSEKTVHRNVCLHSEQIRLDGIHGRVLDLEMTVSSIKAEAIFDSFVIQFAQSDEQYSELSIIPKAGRVTVSRSHSGADPTNLNERETALSEWNGKLCIRMILDYCSAEIFIGDGETVFSMTLETDPEAEDITFISQGDLILNVTAYRLDPTLV